MHSAFASASASTRTAARARAHAHQPRDDHRRGNTKAARDFARPLLAKWLKRVEAGVSAGELIDFDLRLAKELLSYPSANLGHSFPGLERLGAKLDRCKRALIYRLNEFVKAGLLHRERRARRSSNCYTFCLDGEPLIAPEQGSLYFGSQTVGDADTVSTEPVEVQSVAPHVAPPEVQSVAPPEVQSVAPKNLEREILEREPSPQPPSSGATWKGEGEGIFDLEEEAKSTAITFEELLKGTKADGDQGPTGFASAEFRKLSRADLCAISDKLRREGRIEIGRMWLGTWLKDRHWEHGPLGSLSGGFSELAAASAALATPPPPPPDAAEIARQQREAEERAQANRRRQIDHWTKRILGGGYKSGRHWADDPAIYDEALAEIEIARAGGAELLVSGSGSILMEAEP